MFWGVLVFSSEATVMLSCVDYMIVGALMVVHGGGG